MTLEKETFDRYYEKIMSKINWSKPAKRVLDNELYQDLQHAPKRGRFYMSVSEREKR